MDNNQNFEQDLSSKKRLSIICMIAGVVLLFGGFALFSMRGVIPGLVPVAAGIAVLIYGGKISKELTELTVPIRKSVLEEKLELQSYNVSEHFPKDLVRSTKLFTGWSSISGSDLVAGLYRGIPVRFCDLHLTHQESNGKTTTTVTDFKGTFLEITAHRSISSEVRVKEQGKGLFRSKVIEMENEAFNKKFTVTGESTQDAFYVLTPQFMETIMKADQYADARTQMLFSGSQIYVGLYNSRDLFEVKSQKTLEGYRAACRSDLAYVTNFLDILFENTALFDRGRMK